MKLQEIFDQLTYGELSQYVVGGKGSNGIQFESYPEIINHINLGLTALYKRFVISKKELSIVPQTGLFTYVLHPDYLIGSNSNKPYKYLVASSEFPFNAEVLSILQIFDSDQAEIQPNSSRAINPVYFDSPYLVRLPSPNPDNPVTLVYQSNHPKIILNSMYAQDTEIELPILFLDCLLFFIGSRVAASNPSINDTNVQDSAQFMAKYELACTLIEQKGLLKTEEEIVNGRFEQGGWV